ncbi:FAD-dependent oxidoreductase [Flavobacterium sp. SM2513]|uniref:FAD-dependent oxidoreductase n=1 Tax=Flavobacterium sp. SM2513 TaxID=3424766 RepID=UPI003D7F2F93
MENKKTSWTICQECQGQGTKKQRISKKAKLRYQNALSNYEKYSSEGTPPKAPKSHLNPCRNCAGTGIIASHFPPTPDNVNFPHVAIIGAGIGGIALAAACLHRGIPFTIYERDKSFDDRSQGYGLTLQQASKAIEGLGIISLKEGVVSTKHVVHTTDGKVIGEWGVRKWFDSVLQTTSKRTNIHIARQHLRLSLLKQLDKPNTIHWNHQLIDLKESENGVIELSLRVKGTIKTAMADLVIGADGIRSTVRKVLIGEEINPLRYLDCIVILGICPLKALDGIENPLLDSATVFQTANGNERIYMMPYTSDSIMWQLSFPMSEDDAKILSAQGPEALKKEACIRTQWHSPIPEILAATSIAQISGYPVYDRELLRPEILSKEEKVTLLGDAAHPMSPFKGQGANQALLDALALARGITKGCRPLSEWRKVGIRKSVLDDFELEMLQRSAIKVKDSADAAQFLHSESVLNEGDGPRGRYITK